MEEGTIHDIGAGTEGTIKEAAGVQIMESAVQAFHCPSRRPAIPYPYGTGTPPVNVSGNVKVSAMIDYGASGGDTTPDPLPEGPDSFDEGDQPTYEWDDASFHTGVLVYRNTIRVAKITDGTANTYMVGEKYLNPFFYLTGESFADDSGAYVGHDWDTVRWTFPGNPVGEGSFAPRQDQPGLSAWQRPSVGLSHGDVRRVGPRDQLWDRQVCPCAARQPPRWDSSRSRFAVIVSNKRPDHLLCLSCCASPVMGTKATGAMVRSTMLPSERFSMSSRFCRYRPTGITSRPPGASCSTNG